MTDTTGAPAGAQDRPTADALADAIRTALDTQREAGYSTAKSIWANGVDLDARLEEQRVRAELADNATQHLWRTFYDLVAI